MTQNITAATSDFASVVEGWPGLGVLVRHDRPTDTWMLICLHDNTLGPCTGGTRMKPYDTLGEAVRDAQRLAEGMTHKWAALGRPWGGAKAVLKISRPLDGDERRGLLRRYAAMVEALRGGFYTGEDLGTSTADMVVMAEVTAYVHGFDPETGSKIDPSPYTAQAVFAGIRAAAGRVLGSKRLDGASVLVQGVGNVGGRLAELVAEAGARVLVSDLDERRAADLAGRLGGEAVPAEAVYDTACDVYAPCAIGGTLSAETVPRLACRIVAGSANNQLAAEDDAARLEARGILYVPDYIINAGGALAFARLGDGVKPGEELLREVEKIGDTVDEVLVEAAERAESPLAAARRRVERNLAAGRTAA